MIFRISGTFGQQVPVASEGRLSRISRYYTGSQQGPVSCDDLHGNPHPLIQAEAKPDFAVVRAHAYSCDEMICSRVHHQDRRKMRDSLPRRLHKGKALLSTFNSPGLPSLLSLYLSLSLSPCVLPD